MKKILFFSILSFILFSAHILKKKTIQIEGQVMFEDKTMDVIFNFPLLDKKEKILHYPLIEREVEYLDSNGKSIILKPNEIVGIQFSHKDETIKMFSMKMPFGYHEGEDIYRLLHLSVEGRVNLFWTYGVAGDWPGQYLVRDYYLQKEGEDIMRAGLVSFRKDMMKYFSDCRALVKKIDKREIRGSSVEEAVDFYNNKCE